MIEKKRVFLYNLRVEIMKYAVIKTGGNQYRVFEGDELLVDRLDEEEGKNTNFEEILLFVNENKVKIGDPLVKGVSVKGKVLSHLKGEKIMVSKFKAKSRYRKVKGFRHSLTKVKILSFTS